MSAHAGDADGCVDVEVKEVSGRGERELFLRLPWRLYRADPCWVPPLLSSTRRLLDPSWHPFHEQAEVRLFLARKSGRVVGRIASIINHAHISLHRERTGFWGFFECENDAATAKALFDKVAEYFRSRGLTALRGPFNPTINRECGLLTEGTGLPAILTSHNPPFYRDLVLAAGFTLCRELLSFTLSEADLSTHQHVIRRLSRLADAARELSPDLGVRCMDRRHYRKEVATFTALFNTARRENWGFVPPSASEVRFLAAEMKPVVDPRLVLIARVGGVPVGCALALPDLNPLLRRINGKLWPHGWLRLFLSRRRVRGLRVFGVACLPEFRNLGVVAVLCHQMLRNARRLGYRRMELSWIDKQNRDSIRLATNALGAHHSRTHGIYERAIE